MATVAATPSAFSIAQVINRTFGAIGRNFVTFFLLSVVAVSPLFVTRFFSPLAQTSFNANASPSQVMTQLFSNPQYVAIFVVSIFVYVAFAFVLQAALAYGTVADLNGRRASFGACLSTGLSVFLPMIGVAFLVALGVWLGLILLIVPGIMLAMRWIVAAPARVMEGPGILKAMGRSAELTRGHRWPIFGLVIIFFLAEIAFSAVVGVFTGVAALTAAAAATTVTLASIVNWLVSAIVTMFSAVGIASIYYELRSSKEGIGPEHLAAVFS
jgi:uncharacterized membrane protein